MFLFNLLGRGSGDTYAVFLLPLEREFGWARSQLTGVYSMYLLVGAFIAPLAGPLFDRYGPRTTYSDGLACLAAAFLLASSLGNLWEFYLFVGVMIGVGVGLVGMVPASALIMRWYRERLSSAIGIAFAAGGMGGLLFVPSVQLLLGAFDWRTVYQMLGVLMFRAFRLRDPDGRLIEGASMRAGGTSMYWAKRFWLIPMGRMNSSSRISPGGLRSSFLAMAQLFSGGLSVAATGRSRIIDNFDVVGIVVIPLEADSPLIVDSNAVASGPVASQGFHAISARGAQMGDYLRAMLPPGCSGLASAAVGTAAGARSRNASAEKKHPYRRRARRSPFAEPKTAATRITVG